MSRSSDLKFWSRSIFGIAIFTSAFLLFQVQLLLGKFLLPWFGGTSAIWATRLLFFQVLLLGGYVYAHQIASAFRPSLQGKAHLAFLAITSLCLVVVWYCWSSPVLPGPSWKPAPGAAPILGIVELLSVWACLFSFFPAPGRCCKAGTLILILASTTSRPIFYMLCRTPVRSWDY